MTTSTSPSWILWTAVALCFVSAISRQLLLPRTVVNRRINIALVFEGMGVAMRAPALQDWIEPHVPSTLIVRTASHMFIMLAGIAILGVVRSWTGRERNPRTQIYLYLGILAVTAAMLWFSAPSRAAHVDVEAHGTWNAVAYFSLYTAVNLFAYGRICLIFIADRKSPVTGRGKITAHILIAVCAVAVIDNGWRFITAVSIAMGLTDAVGGARASLTDLLFLAPVTVFALVAWVPVAGVAKDFIGGGQDSADIRALTPMWKLLTGSVPEVLFDRDGGRRPMLPRHRLHRQVVEIRDATLVVDSYRGGIDDDAIAAAVDAALADQDTETRALVAENAARILAVETRSRNPMPRISVNPNEHRPFGTILFDEDRANLLTAAKCWPAAVQIADQLRGTPAKGTAAREPGGEPTPARST